MRMLYKYPGIHPIHNDNFDYIIINEADINQYIKDGWFLTTSEAKSSIPKKKSK